MQVKSLPAVKSAGFVALVFFIQIRGEQEYIRLLREIEGIF
jgi:hypothetical protein